MISSVIDGVSCAGRLAARVSADVRQLKKREGIIPGLAMVVLGRSPASCVYVAAKNKKAIEVGIRPYTHWLPENTTQEELLNLIGDLNRSDQVDGIVVQLPLPGHISEAAVFGAIEVEKDVDGLGEVNGGRLFSGDRGVGFIPCTPQGCMLLLKTLHQDPTGLEAVVVGRSRLVGRPMAHLLLQAGCTVTIAHSKTKSIEEVCRRGDILVVAVGVPRLVQATWVKPGATVIDVGINRMLKPSSVEDQLVSCVGDVDFHNVKDVAGAITPVPGGVGPMTVGVLLANTLLASMSRRDLCCDSLRRYLRDGMLG